MPPSPYDTIGRCYQSYISKWHREQLLPWIHLLYHDDNNLSDDSWLFAAVKFTCDYKVVLLQEEPQ